ncbi:hypothetical protein SAMN05518801_10937 [Novosphingobium sp. CF614]|uniref:hypothetical protein n=1 Tax=Novosphingobium sp. CF614 TaxID=1884364 RepID=UPI0008E35E6E|nr:hypothetical protein [Novosphingobium sp. CF614]SFG17263.1 hypothetical protein SAMN05518801_10937 [Novosphingobium sp. CF614]
MDHYYEVEQGVAVTGGPRIGMCTTTLYNCLGVAAVGKGSRRGGLYHYPSLCRDKSYVVVTLTRMLNNVLPDWVGITPAAIASATSVPTNFDKGSDPKDIDWLKTTVQKLAPSAKVFVLDGKRTATLFWDGQWKYNEFPSAAPAEIRPRMSAIPNVITGRPQNGDAWAYGIDVELNEVED